MDIKPLPINLGKLLVCGAVFSAGTQIGGIVASFVGLQASQVAPGADRDLFLLYSLLVSPLLALALALVAQGLAGSIATRTLILSLLTWIAYSVCDQLEGLLVSTYSSGLWFAVVESFLASLLCGGAVAVLFPPAEGEKSAVIAGNAFFTQREVGAWVWRVVLASIAFMPIYFIFGLLVLPLVRQVYDQNLYGLKEPAVDQLAAILFARSVLFLVACLPILVTWQRSRQSLLFRLGSALFLLVALPSTVTAYWLPLNLRLAHSLEILGDEFVYCGVLIALLVKGGTSDGQERHAPQESLASGCGRSGGEEVFVDEA